LYSHDMPKSKQYGVRLPDPLREKVERRAQEEDRTVSKLIRRALTVYVNGEQGNLSPEAIRFVRWLERLGPEDRALVRAFFHRLGYPEGMTTAEGSRGR